MGTISNTINLISQVVSNLESKNCFVTKMNQWTNLILISTNFLSQKGIPNETFDLPCQEVKQKMEGIYFSFHLNAFDFWKGCDFHMQIYFRYQILRMSKCFCKGFSSFATTLLENRQLFWIYWNLHWNCLEIAYKIFETNEGNHAKRDKTTTLWHLTFHIF